MNMEYRDIIGYQAAFVLKDSQLLEDHVVLVNKRTKRIISVVPVKDAPAIEIRNFGNKLIMPGLIDTHTHGAMSFDTMDASHHSLNEMSKFFASKGVVAFTPTTVTAPDEKIVNAISQVRDSMLLGVDGAEILGTYLEGPFLGYENRGAHPLELLQNPCLKKLEEWIDISDGTIVAVALAPELKNSQEIVNFLHERNINTMLAHTSADYECCKRLLDNNATGIVHCYNGMTGLHHREPGAVGAALTHKSAFVELIVDGHHVHPAAVDVAYRCCGDNRLVLITDSMCAAGMPDGEYKLGELDVKVTESVCRTEAGGLAGSTLTLDAGIKNLAKMLDNRFVDIWHTGSEVPAKMLNREEDFGRVSAGKIGSFVVVPLEKELSIFATIVNGKVVYEREEI
ncbi:N-acetylglucosamine-6-phosphate deacetylase [Vibrio sp. Hep-1b-8]|uniref:N-acetylglucosamine-6-phosphate deacetylase n=1 Tax=Vibrio sp. Hep-1b-8 TaxID=2144187 RepID=UPI001F105C30|nr:N-acetylglucosamine-6-phosphate deacetylase [Vibrio sp. Hep-1b-8]